MWTSIIVSVSIDAEQSRAKQRVEQADWSKLEHIWAGQDGRSDFDAPAARAFGVSGVPEAVLIGKDGRILWRGHPLDDRERKDYASRIEEALK